MASDTLPENGATTAGYFSPTRDDYLRETLENYADSALGRGVVSGGAVTKTAAFTVQLASGTVLAARGVTYTLTSAISRSGLNASATNYVFARIARTVPTYTGSGATLNLPTYSAELTHNTTGATPAGNGWILVAVVTTDASGITSIEEWPAGKMLDSVNMVQSAPDTIAVGSVGVVESGRQLVLANGITVRGKLVNRGRVTVRRF
jgi:hypothetical protein